MVAPRSVGCDMGSLTIEQQARRAKRRAKAAPRKAARFAAKTAVAIARGEGVSGHARMKLKAWEMDPTRDMDAFKKAALQFIPTGGVIRHYQANNWITDAKAAMHAHRIAGFAQP